MKTTISIYDFRNAFMQTGRKDQFSYDGLEIIFKHIEDVEDSCGQEFELDVIGICCDYAEDEARGIAESYGIDVSGMSDADAEITVLDYLADNSALIGSSQSGIVYRQF
jgi:hypothetical protein